VHVPPIDPRTMASLIEQMKEMAPHYTPEWRFTPEDPDPGTALFLLFARMLDENIKRLNRVPHKNFIAFLNLLDISLQAPKPAGAYLTFHLSEGADRHVLVPDGTRVAGLPTDGGAEPIIFETQGPMVVTPAKLTQMFNVSSAHDRIVRLSLDGREEHSVPLFDTHEGSGRNLQEHTLYLKLNDLFLVRHGAALELELSHTQKRYTEPLACELLANPRMVEWRYYSEGAWIPFDEVSCSGNRVLLQKRTNKVWSELELEGVQGRWLQCAAGPITDESGTLPLAELELDGLRLKGSYLDFAEEGGIAPQRMYFNDIQVENDGFHPFGEMFAPFGIFYAASDEVLSKRGAWITADFTLSFKEYRLYPEKPPEVNWKMIMRREEVDKVDIPDRISVVRVVWEYWNGNGWVRLPVAKEAESIFFPWTEENRQVQIAFRCPEDVSETFVNSDWNYWIRARVLNIDNMYSPNAVYISPWVENVRFTYDDLEQQRLPEHCLTRNHVETLDYSRNLEGTGNVFRPFLALSGQRPAVYLGFDRRMERGPISIYFSLQQQRMTEQEAPLLDWEYLEDGWGLNEWRPLKVRDGTGGFVRSGTVQFLAPSDMGEASLFGTKGFWLRVLNKDGRLDQPIGLIPKPKVRGIRTNTVLALQQESIVMESPERSIPEYVYEDEHTEVILARSPVVSEEVWVDETEQLHEDGVELLTSTGRPVQVLRDSDGRLMKCWVKYDPVSHFLASGPEDRHYVIDRTSGRLKFGDGVRGKRLPNDDTERIKVNYKSGGGERGNLPRHRIQSLQSSIAFLQGVTNEEPASGGCDAETMEQAIRRGPQRLKHRDRAVTSEDYEWLAREAYPNISKVKCLPNVNVRLEREAGCMTVVVLPKGEGQTGAAFQEIKNQVESYLYARAPHGICFPGKIGVIEPAYLEVGVQVVLAVKSMDEAIQAETDALERMERFLHPLHGGFDGRGWDIGKALHASMFYALFKSIGSIHHVIRLSLSVLKLEDGVRTEVLPEKMNEYKHGVIKNGLHKVTVQIV
jgi:hypothetical protein